MPDPRARQARLDGRRDGTYMGEAQRMTTGVKTYNSAGQTTQKFDNKPIAPKIYEAILKSEGVAINTASNGKPFLTGVRFELKGTASVEGGKNRGVNHSFWLDVNPFKADGIPSIRKADGIVPLARTMGEELDLPVQDVETRDQEGNPTTAELLDARAAKKWLQERDGRTLQLKTKLEASKDDPNVKYARVAFFVEQQTTGGGSDASMPAADDVVIP